jgi:hypothetical protein
MLCLAAGDVGRYEILDARMKIMRVRQWRALGVRLSAMLNATLKHVSSAGSGGGLGVKGLEAMARYLDAWDLTDSRQW